MFKHLWACLLIGIVSLPQTLPAKEVVGWVEKARLYPGGLTIKAKVDTGAKSSSINCNCITPIEEHGEKWVRFSVKNEWGELKWFKRKIRRTVRIKRHFGKSQERFVVRLGLCLGKTYKETDVNLVDRSGLNYQLLIGRRFLEGSHIVDPGVTYTSKPRCKGPVLHE